MSGLRFTMLFFLLVGLRREVCSSVTDRSNVSQLPVRACLHVLRVQRSEQPSRVVRKRPHVLPPPWLPQLRSGCVMF